MRGVVPPRAHARKLAYRHDLNRVDAKLLEVPQASRDGDELSRSIRIIIVKGADMQFVNHKLTPWCEAEAVITPVKAGIMNDGITHRVCDFARMGVYACDHTTLCC